MALVVKNLPANAGDLRDMGRSLSWEKPLEKGMTTYLSILTWRIPWTEEPGRLPSIELQSRRRLKGPSTCAHAGCFLHSWTRSLKRVVRTARGGGGGELSIIWERCRRNQEQRLPLGGRRAGGNLLWQEKPKRDLVTRRRLAV